MLILMVGLPGTGKSTLAKAISSPLGAIVLDRDTIRDTVFPVEEIDYSDEQNEVASQIAYMIAKYILQRNPHKRIILDGRPFSKKQQRDVIVEMADQTNQQLKVIYCWAPDDIVKERLKNTSQNYATVRTFEKYKRIKSEFEPLQLPHLKVNMALPLSKAQRKALEYFLTE